MNFYQYDNDGIFIYSAVAQPSPLEPGEYMLPHNATLIEPPTCEQDEYAIFIAEKWQIRKRLEGVYWHKKTLEQLVVTDPYDGNLTGYTTIQPPAHHADDNLAFKKGEWVLTMGGSSLSAYREHLVNLANEQCQDAIVAKYPPHKQMNLLSENMNKESPDFLAMHNFISEQRAACKALKASINTASQRQLTKIEGELNG
jgi:hypothetical protein